MSGALLGFDTSTNATAVCVLRGDGQAFEHVPEPARLLDRPGHAAELMPAVARAMDDAGVAWDDLDGIAVGVGPGTFTGLRIGIATARALAHARGLPVHPVSSLAALADQLDGDRARLPLIDARRGELFAALYDADGERWAPFVAAPDALAERVAKAFPGADRPLAAGDGSIKSRAVLEAAGVEVPGDDSLLHVVRALSVCRLAQGAQATAPEAVVPLYLRDPDAKPQQLP
jgi:tRNA threonylcarbamoyladenosine biosynthesis protein TsaB